MNSITEKKCLKCKEVKDVNLFSKDKNKKSGLNSYCKSCMVVIRKSPNYKESNQKSTKKWELLNPEKHKDSKKKWRSKNAEKIRDYDREYQKEYYQKNLEKKRRQGRIRVSKYKANHPDRVKKAIRNWRDKNPEKEQVYKNNRKNNTIGKFTSKEWQDLCDKYDNKCLRCGEKKKMTIDHVIPVSKGGLNIIENIQPLCLSCNMSKYDKIMDFRT